MSSHLALKLGYINKTNTHILEVELKSLDFNFVWLLQNRVFSYLSRGNFVVAWLRPPQNAKLGMPRRSRAKTGGEMYKKSVVHVQSSCFANETYCSFLRSRYRPSRWILKSLLYMEEGTKLVCRKSELVCGKCKGSPKRGLISNIVYY